MNGMNITDKRLIGVLFNELSFLEHSVIYSFANSDGTFGSVMTTAPKVSVDDPRNPKINILDSKISAYEVLSIEFILNGKRFLGTVEQDGSEGTYTLPTVLTIDDRREEERKQLIAHKGCEIIWNSKKILGTPLNLNSNYFSCQISGADGQSLRFSDIKSAIIVVYGTGLNSGLTFSNVTVSSCREQESSDYVVVFQIESTAKSLRGERSAPRASLAGNRALPLVSLESGKQISPTIKVLGNIVSLSLSGFAFKPIGEPTTPIAGILYYCPELQVSFRFARVINESEYAFSFVFSAETDDQKWTQFLEQHTDLLSVKQINSEKIGKFLVECGFIRGQRREYYGENPSSFLVDEWLGKSGLFRRYVEHTSNMTVSGQCSAVRISGACWLIQEAGTGIFKQSDFRELLTKTMVQMGSEGNAGLIEVKNFTTIYDPLLKPPKHFWADTLSKDGTVYNCWHSLRPTGIKRRAENSITDLQSVNIEAVEISALANTIPGALLKAFGFLELHLQISNTNRQLNSLSSAYGVRSKVLVDSQTSNIAALIFYYHGPYTLNVSGLVNSIFIFPAEKCLSNKLEEIIDAVSCIEEFKGTSDLLIVFDQKTSEIDRRVMVDKRFEILVDSLASYLAKLEANKNVA